MNFKTKNSNLTKSLYIILILCIISIVCLSVYAFFSQKDNSNSAKLLEKAEKSGYDGNLNNNKNDDLLKIFGTTEPKQQNAPTEVITEPPSNSEQIPSDDRLPQAPTAPVPNETPLPTERAAEVVDDSQIEIPDIDSDTVDAIETLAVPSFFLRPLVGSVLKFYNEDTPEYSVIMNDYRTHLGIDIESDIGANVKAAADGVISEIYDDPMMGKTVVISHIGGIESVYMNLLEMLPQNIVAGIVVRAGDVIGGVGESSLIEVSDVPHLHFAMKKDGIFINPLEYVEY